MSKPMNLAELLARACRDAQVPSNAAAVRITDICCDSRRAAPGSLFVALRGAKQDGGAFIANALSREAAAVVSETPCQFEGAACVVVPDARVALARLAAAFFGLDRILAEGGLTVLGVTGTNGKSTWAYMMRGLLNAAGYTTALLGTIQYDVVSRTLESGLTTPDPIELSRYLVEAHRAGASHAVMEVSSHSLDQRRTDGVRFAVAVFTNLTQDHLDYHGGLERYFLAKRRLFDNLSADAVAVVNAHDPASRRIVEHFAAKGGRVMRFGLAGVSGSGEDGARPPEVIGRVLSEGRAGGRFELQFGEQRMEMHTPLVGRHNILNALAAASAGLALGMDLSTIRRGLVSVSHVPGRLQAVPTADLGFDVYVDYAHTDDALRNVLAAVRPLASGSLWCLFGCGGDRDRTKRPKMARAAAAGADRVVVTSDNPRSEDPGVIIDEIIGGFTPADLARVHVEPDRAAAIAWAVERLSAGDVLVIAGKGHENYQIIGTSRTHFDDVEVARAAIARRFKEAPCAS